MINSQISPQEAARELLARRRARKNLQAFTEYTTPRWKAGKIHRAVCENLDRVVRREVDRLMILCPPQHGKSTITSERYPAYWLGKDPTEDIISASATATLAEKFGRIVRNCVASQEFQRIFPETRLAEDSQAKGSWNTNRGGSYYAVGVGGQLFGRGGGAIIDDPFGSWADAQSETLRENVWEWYTGTLYNRIRPGKPIIVIQHRMHEDDLVGRLLQQQAAGGDIWEVVELPALLDDPPWPERYDREALERIKTNTDPRKWSALYLQNPTPEEGTFFKREWFLRHEPFRGVPKNLRLYGFSDYAVTEDDGDYTEHGLIGVDSEGRIHQVDWWHGQTTSDQWIESMIDMVALYRPLVWFGEGGVIQKAIEPALKRRMRERKARCRLEWVPSIHDKPTRARGIQSRAALGEVSLLSDERGERVLSQMLSFPAGKYDDAVDVMGLIGRVLDMAHPALVEPPKEEEDEFAYRPPTFNELVKQTAARSGRAGVI